MRRSVARPRGPSTARWLLGLALVLGAIPAMPPEAHATTAVYLSEVEHAARSTAVIRGTVVARTVDRDPVFHRIRTRSRVKVHEVLMGDAPAEVVVDQMGGRLGDEVLLLPGDAVLEIGADVVLFLREVDGNWYLTALEQSKYDVVPSVDGLLLERTLGEGLFVRSKGGGLEPWLDDAPGQPLTLERLRWILADAGLSVAPDLDAEVGR